MLGRTIRPAPKAKAAKTETAPPTAVPLNRRRGKETEFEAKTKKKKTSKKKEEEDSQPPAKKRRKGKK